MVNNELYELRLYQVERGRMTDMIARRRGALQMLFQKHGITPLGNWYTTSGRNSPLFVYLMRWPDWNTRQKAWAGFYSDPEWWTAREETNAGSELVERYELNMLKAIHSWTEQPGINERILELHIPKIDIGRSVAAATMIRENMNPQLIANGAELLGAFEYLTGDDLPRAALFVGWKNDADADLGQHYMEQAPLNRSDRYRLKPIPL